MTIRVEGPPVSPELSDDPRFLRRIHRLVIVSSVMLGLIALLATLTPSTRPLAIGLLVMGWILMPTLLRASVRRPRMRYLLAVPATLVSAGVFSVAAGLERETASLGWWLMMAGVLFGGALGAWFWYRLIPVPAALDDPFSPGRIALIAVHVGLVISGMGLVILG
jgi:hypothetical protein